MQKFFKYIELFSKDFGEIKGISDAAEICVTNNDIGYLYINNCLLNTSVTPNLNKYQKPLSIKNHDSNSVLNVKPPVDLSSKKKKDLNQIYEKGLIPEYAKDNYLID